MKALLQTTAFAAALLLATAPARAQTQAALTTQACDELTSADQELNRLYQKARQLYAGQAAFLAALKTSQVAWVRFRDAQAAALYPPPPAGTAGSAAPQCRCRAVAALTTARNAQLQAWVAGQEEGDVCAGSIRRR
ncbi:lysozyme inhibitor LprI family protein [Hymenobacter sp.]|uniref:lysozyme inhibitor LprI family protein n=1 Tax=Hymenobacter sp. TaxID=1898978 RepID=UPI00286ABBCA|nr:lysozyme inhibitor LprI family protein [Hymenobacter sp.]